MNAADSVHIIKTDWARGLLGIGEQMKTHQRYSRQDERATHSNGVDNRVEFHVRRRQKFPKRLTVRTF